MISPSGGCIGIPRLIFLRRGTGDSAAASSLLFLPSALTVGFVLGGTAGLGVGSVSF